MSKVAFKYVGSGFIPGIPARDITEDEVENFDINALEGSGLWEKKESKSSKSVTPPKEDKMVTPKTTNKDVKPEAKG